MNLSSIDLNLLVALDALLQERSVTRAAVRVGLSQPAMSNALARLRGLLGDPVLVRGRGGMVPTPRAQALAGPVRGALAQLQGALNAPATFAPERAERTFLVAASDHAQVLFLPGLMPRLAQAPGLRLRVVPLPQHFPAEELETGQLDLVVGAFGLAPGDEIPGALQRQRLVHERIVGVARQGRRAALERASAAELVALPQISVAPRGGTTGAYARELERHGLRQNSVLWVPHFSVAPLVAARTDLVVALPERLALAYAAYLPLELHTRLGGLQLPGFDIVQVWHERAREDPAHRWLRGQLAEVAAALPGVPAPRPRRARRQPRRRSP